MRGRCVLGVDQGTSGTTAVLLDEARNLMGASPVVPVSTTSPRPGWVECDPQQMLHSVETAMRAAVDDAGVSPDRVVCIGLANQGETVIAFDSSTGEPLYPAISWQDRRGEEYLRPLRSESGERELRKGTGLLPRTYFSAPKMRWLLDNAPGAAGLVDRGQLTISTSDTWLLHQLLSEQTNFTDPATASRTLLFDLRTRVWHDGLVEAFGIPGSVLPRVVANDAMVGTLPRHTLGVGVACGGLCVDQQAALLGQRCLRPGDAKITYGTGCFLQVNLGDRPELRAPGLLTSVGWRVEDRWCYVVEGGVYHAGFLVQWLIEQMGLARSPDEIEALAQSVPETGGVLFVPALTGLGAPHHSDHRGGAWKGLNQNTTSAHLVRAVLESIAFRVQEIWEALEAASVEVGQIRVDGGMSRSRFLMQLQADLLGRPLHVFRGREATAVGAALLSGLACSMWSMDDLAGDTDIAGWDEVLPAVDGEGARERYEEWKRAMRECLENPA